MTKAERIEAILASKRRTNVPHPSGEKGMRIVGWVVHEDVAGLSDALFAVEEIQKMATRDLRKARVSR